MGTTLHNFIDIFNSNFEVSGESIQLNKIVIPIIQRDYAQGRTSYTVNRVRERFLNALKDAICNEPVTLDFVYGDIDENGQMTPLDGQQRLTTLFLLHYYAAKKECVDGNEYDFLKNFSYETRYSARDFCKFLVDEFNPTFTKPLSEEIEDHAKFPLDWKKDPTINSMLVMLDAIDKVFSDVDNIWSKLKNGAVSFYFLPIKDMGLTDELYIKMNSRGKPLTQFEHFKAELEHELRKIDVNIAKEIGSRIDKEWTDMLWFYRGEDNIIDDEFLRYFNYICTIICYENGGTTQGKSADEFDLLKEYFSTDCENALENISTLKSYFDCWCNLGGYSNPQELMKNFISYNHEENKIQIDTRYDIDVFNDCLKNNNDTGARNRQFPLNRIVMLYAVIMYLLNKDKITENQFSRRLRVINNLILNSEYEISDSEVRTSGNRMPAILKQTRSIIVDGIVDSSIDKNFNAHQLAEETEKLQWVSDNPEKAESLFYLEDHPLLDGQIGIIGLDNIDYGKRFYSLFECDYDAVDCALMSLGFYGQMDVNKKRYQVGSGSKRNEASWKSLFHRSNSVGFEKTKEILLLLLSKHETFDDDKLKEIADNYIKACETLSLFEWRYYYVKYPIFRPKSYGKIWWDDFTNKPYELFILQTKTNWSENTYQPFLKEADEVHLSRDYCGQYITIGEDWYECANNAFVKTQEINDEDIELDRLVIDQNNDGIDTENRINKFVKYLNV